MIKCLQKCLDKNGNWNTTRFLQLKREEKIKFERAYNFLWLIYRDNSLTINEMYKLYIQNIFHPLVCLCDDCTNIVHIRTGNKNKQFGFALFCSNTCLNKSVYRKETISKTCKERYGGVGFGSEHHKNKACKTMKEKYGVEYYVLAGNFEEKRVKTYQEKYGVTSPMKSSKIKATHQNNMLQKYGIHNSLCTGIIREQAIITTEKMYGDRQIMATSYIRKLKEEKGDWLPLNKKSDFELYCRAVNKYTTNTINTFQIENIEKIAKLEYSLDHIYSKK